MRLFASVPHESMASMSSPSTSSTQTSDAPRLEVLRTAALLTSSDREAQYGDCLTNHQAFGELIEWWARWAGTLERKHWSHDAAVLQALTKLARIAVGRFHHDNYVDAAAYLAIAFECETRERHLEASQGAVGRGSPGGD